jgi:signal transduction histidine kinase
LYVVPNEEKLKRGKDKWLVVATGSISLFTLTPYVFVRVLEFTQGRVSRVQNGPGIAIFGLFVLSVISYSLFRLVVRIIRSDDLVKKQLKPFLVGMLIMFGLLVIFNFIFPAFLNNPRFVPMGGVFIFPFIVSASYAIIRRKLLNVKILSTEILVFVLGIATFIEVIVSNTLTIVIFRSSVFILVLGVGILLIRSVINEVKQREQLQILTEQLKEANVKLEALDKARAEFISIASHQLRTPPATIKWYIGAVLSGDFGELNEEVKSALDRVQSTNNSQISLIDDLLNASRIERGKMEFFFEKADLAELARITYDQLLPQAKMRKIELIYNVPTEALPAVMMDKEKVRQVINNMVDNAIKYTKQGSVTMSIEKTPTDLVMKVKDTGRGVDPKIAPTLFSKYTRGKDAATAATGLGLGLYVAKVIIEQNHGRIWVESEGEGKGSTFIFSLPLKSDLEETAVVDLAEAAHK